ncbi:MAG: hypothetical protein ACRDIZ_08930 [Actinomycetota bacterium]
MKRTAVAALAAAVLGAGCTDDRTTRPTPTAGTPRCENPPGRGPEGFTLKRSREFDEGDRVATRLDYLDPEGRRLVYLLGLSGGIGEGLPLLARTTLPGGQAGRFLGRGEAWMLVWEDPFPCPQMAVVGNGFEREDFVRLLSAAGLVRPSETSSLVDQALTEWVAAFHTATDLDELDDDTDALMEVAPRSLIVGPVGCHQGLAEALGVPEVETYFSGVVAGTQEALDRAVARVARHPLFQDGPEFAGEMVVLCLGD